MDECNGNGPINYTGNVPSLFDIEWVSQPDFTYSLFGSIHKAANASLNWIFPNHEDYQGYRINPDDLLDFTSDSVDVDEMVWSNRGPLAFAIIGIIFGAVLTIFGIGWCLMKCCSCCCSRKSRSADRYHSGYYDDDELLNKFGYEERKEKRIRICCGVTLIVWVILSLASLGSLFAFNDQMREAVDGIPSDLELSLNDTELYLRTTQRQVNGVLVTSYSNLSDNLTCLLDEIYPSSMKSSIIQLQELSNLSEQLQLKGAADLERSLNLTIEALSEFCKDNVCEQQEELTKNLSTMAAMLKAIGAIPKNLGTYATETLSKLHTTDQQLLSTEDEIREAIAEEGRKLQDNAAELTNSLGTVIESVKDARDDLREVEDEFDKVNPPLYISILVIVLFLLLVSILFFVGGLLSFFAKSNNVVTKTRSITLNCGLMLIFIFGGILWIFTMACFLLSGVITQVIPANLRYLENYNSTEVDSLLHRSVGTIANDYRTPSYGFIARNCREGNSAYITFELHTVYDIQTIEQLLENLHFEPTACAKFVNSGLNGTMNEILIESSNFKIRVQNSESQLASLTEDLDHAVVTLRKLAKDNADDGINSPSILSSVNSLDSMRVPALQKLKTGLEVLDKTFASTEAEFSKINNGIRETPCEKFEAHVHDYVEFAKNEIYFNVGECQPLHNALHSTINLFTYKIGSPIAGFWFSLNVVMLLFFPSIITATVLQRL